MVDVKIGLLFIYSYVKVGRLGEKFEFLEYNLDQNNPIVPRFLGYRTSTSSVGLFAFGDFEERGRKYISS